MPNYKKLTQKKSWVKAVNQMVEIQNVVRFGDRLIDETGMFATGQETDQVATAAWAVVKAAAEVRMGQLLLVLEEEGE